VQFSASANDSDGVREYLWNFGDGTSATGPSPQKVFNVSGHYPIRLTVVDRLGNASMRIMAMPIGSSTGVLPAPPNHLRIVRTD
jgi:PKD repeat protein